MGKPELPVRIFPLFSILIWADMVRARSAFLMDALLKLLLRKVVWLGKNMIFLYWGSWGKPVRTLRRTG